MRVSVRYSIFELIFIHRKYPFCHLFENFRTFWNFSSKITVCLNSNFSEPLLTFHRKCMFCFIFENSRIRSKTFTEHNPNFSKSRNYFKLYRTLSLKMPVCQFKDFPKYVIENCLFLWYSTFSNLLIENAIFFNIFRLSKYI